MKFFKKLLSCASDSKEKEKNGDNSLVRTRPIFPNEDDIIKPQEPAPSSRKMYE